MAAETITFGDVAANVNEILNTLVCKALTRMNFYYNSIVFIFVVLLLLVIIILLFDCEFLVNAHIALDFLWNCFKTSKTNLFIWIFIYFLYWNFHFVMSLSKIKGLCLISPWCLLFTHLNWQITNLKRVARFLGRSMSFSLLVS